MFWFCICILLFLAKPLLHVINMVLDVVFREVEQAAPISPQTPTEPPPYH